jgi:hypothetical protein
MSGETDDPVEVKRKRKAFKLWREQCDAEIQELVGTAGGAYFIWRVLQECGLYTSPDSLEASALALHEGKRQVGLWVLEELMNINESLYQRVRNEGASRGVTNA